MEDEAQPRNRFDLLQQYRSHKIVGGGKIKLIEPVPPPTDKNEEQSDGTILGVERGKFLLPIEVSRDYMKKHKPEIDGYFVVYEDGYESFSPAKAFEEGYTPVQEYPPASMDEFYAYTLKKESRKDMSAQKRILYALMNDFTDRRGLRQGWEQIDSEIQNEIMNAWLVIIEKGA